MRWIYHLTFADTPVPPRYAPASLAAEGFVHGSYRDAVRESARLYFPADRALAAWQIDPRRLDVPVDVAATPRGPMPHIHGAIPADAVRAVIPLERIDDAPDEVADEITARDATASTPRPESPGDAPPPGPTG